jgi:hypothetical protein
MSQLQPSRFSRSIRLAIFSIAAALIIVPTVARALQHVDVRETTRLSIRHSWLGVAPPTKVSIAPATVAVLPVVPAAPEHGRDCIRARVPIAVCPAFAVVPESSDPLRGPPFPAV